MNAKFKSKSYKESFKNAFNGLKYAYKNERNVMVIILCIVITTIFGFIFNISNSEWIILILIYGLVFGFELINTAIERTMDLISLDKNKTIKIVKDVSAGSVLVLAVMAFVIGMIIFIPKIYLLLGGVL